jgi:ribosomal protein L32
MAVQKSKKSKSKRDIRRYSKSKFKIPEIFNNKDGSIKIRHFIDNLGNYKGINILQLNKNNKQRKKENKNTNLSGSKS